MTSETTLREGICLLAKSMFDRGLTGGSTGNISARTEDGGLLVSPTGTSFGRLDPGRLSRFDASGRLIDGDPPTKEMPLQLLANEVRLMRIYDGPTEIHNWVVARDLLR